MSEETIDKLDAAGAAEASNQKFGLQKIYVRDISFESPAPEKYLQQTLQPKINMDMGTESRFLMEGLYEVCLNLTITATDKNSGEAAYLVEIKQAGIFMLSGFKESELHYMINNFCPNILFPYAREAVSNIVNRGGYPQLLLSAINFDAIYGQHMEKLRQAQPASETAQ